MSLATINQPWRSHPDADRHWRVELVVQAADMTPGEHAALEPVVAAIETYVALLATGTETDQ